MRGAIYDVQVRAVTTGGDSGHRLYVSGWSVFESGIAGGWTPPRVSVTPADGMLVVNWGDVPVASGFEVVYWPEDHLSDRSRVVAVRDGNGWRAEVAGLVNGETYGVAVRSVRSVAADPCSVSRGQREGQQWVGEEFRGAGFVFGGSDVDALSSRCPLQQDQKCLLQRVVGRWMWW